MLRYHSFYAAHRHLMDDQDMKMLLQVLPYISISYVVVVGEDAGSLTVNINSLDPVGLLVCRPSQ
jgi:hypothetical protein